MVNLNFNYLFSQEQLLGIIWIKFEALLVSLWSKWIQCSHRNLLKVSLSSFLISRFKNVRVSNIHLFLLSLTYKKRKYCFGVKFPKWKFWWIYTFWGLLNPKIIFLAFGLCVCLLSAYSKTNFSRIFQFGILHLRHR